MAFAASLSGKFARLLDAASCGGGSLECENAVLLTAESMVKARSHFWFMHSLASTSCAQVARTLSSR